MNILTNLISSIIGIGKDGDASGKGVLSVISEGSKKISFRRVAAIVILVKIVVPDVAQNGLTWFNVTVIGLCLLASTIKEIFKKG